MTTNADSSCIRCEGTGTAISVDDLGRTVYNACPCSYFPRPKSNPPVDKQVEAWQKMCDVQGKQITGLCEENARILFKMNMLRVQMASIVEQMDEFMRKLANKHEKPSQPRLGKE